MRVAPTKQGQKILDLIYSVTQSEAAFDDDRGHAL